MKNQPEGITLCRVECVLMPQGEIICNGKTIGWFKDLKPYLEKADAPDTLKQRDELLTACEIGLTYVEGSNACAMPDCSVCKQKRENIKRIKQAIANATEDKIIDDADLCGRLAKGDPPEV